MGTSDDGGHESPGQGSESTVPQTGPPRSGVSVRRPPEAVGPYPILERLGTGGMGEVLLAYDEALSRQVALKRVRPDRRGLKGVARRFEVEARVTALLQHPAIVPVYHYAEDGSGAYYTMRPVEGLTLRQLVRRLRGDVVKHQEEWTTPRLIRLFLQACNAVAYAHSRGIIHRDLKPENIMIGPFEEVLVLDWGMARFLRDKPGSTSRPELDRPLELLAAQTASRAFVGTPLYMAPEQLQGQKAGVATEVFALGLILYELLTLRRPWPGDTISDLTAAMERRPTRPSLDRPGGGIPARLDGMVLRALDPDPERRFESVAQFAREVASALDGKAPWEPNVVGASRERWRLGYGKLRADGDVLTLLSRGGPFRYFLDRRLDDNVRVEFDVKLGRGGHELAVWLNAAVTRGEEVREGYCLGVCPGRRRTISLLRSGRDVAGAAAPSFTPGRWYRVSAEREDEHLTLRVDGAPVYSYHDPIPLTAGFTGLTGRSNGICLRNLRVYSRGVNATVSCLAIPDAFFNRRQFEEARVEYDSIAVSHRGRAEARLARLRSALCMIEMFRREDDPDVRTLILDDAWQMLAPGAAVEDSCLGALGRAMIAAERGDAAATHDALRHALERFPGDPHLSTVREWILGQLHALGSADRPMIAELLPLAMDHCMEGWGRRGVRELVHRVRRDWETPSFQIGRSRFHRRDPASVAEATYFCGFWAGRPKLIEASLERLIDGDALRPHHVPDVVFSLMELADHEAARRALDRVGGVADGGEAAGFRRSSRAALLAVEGDLDAAEALLLEGTGDPADRVFNSARLWVARACHDQGEVRRLRRVLEPRGPKDFFAAEHRTWFSLLDGEQGRARRDLEPLIERGDHLKPKNLTNLLYGAYQTSRGRLSEAQRTFLALDPHRWPRSWTLGSYLAAGRLGGGDPASYRRGAFAWERSTLASHQRLLVRVGHPVASE